MSFAPAKKMRRSNFAAATQPTPRAVVEVERRRGRLPKEGSGSRGAQDGEEGLCRVGGDPAALLMPSLTSFFISEPGAMERFMVKGERKSETNIIRIWEWCSKKEIQGKFYMELLEKFGGRSGNLGVCC